VPQVVPIRATVRLEAAPLQSKLMFFSNLLAPTEQVPRVRAIIRKWMIQLRWE